MYRVSLAAFAALSSCALSALALTAAPAQAATLCTLFADAASGRILAQEGKGCDARVTPASTFKIPIALMGFDAGILLDAHHPVWSWQPGFPDWRSEWKKDTDPAYWMAESVVWYSQEITRKLGAERFRRYVDGFGYGNEDVSGEKGKDNGLTASWLSTSLAISPKEQASFLGRMVRGELPVSPQAVAKVGEITRIAGSGGGEGDGAAPLWQAQKWEAAGWQVHGKTGMGFARDAQGEAVRGKPYGWFVGWAVKDGRTLIFARLDRDEERQPSPTSLRAKDDFLSRLPGALDALP